MDKITNKSEYATMKYVVNTSSSVGYEASILPARPRPSTRQLKVSAVRTHNTLFFVNKSNSFNLHISSAFFIAFLNIFANRWERYLSLCYNSVTRGSKTKT